MKLDEVTDPGVRALKAQVFRHHVGRGRVQTGLDMMVKAAQAVEDILTKDPTLMHKVSDEMYIKRPGYGPGYTANHIRSAMEPETNNALHDWQFTDQFRDVVSKL